MLAGLQSGNRALESITSGVNLFKASIVGLAATEAVKLIGKGFEQLTEVVRRYNEV